MQILGVDTRSMPSAYQSTGVSFKVVLKSDGQRVAAYRGVGTEEWVGLWGDFLNLNEAICHFPRLEAEMVARGLQYGKL